jgi:hypothetical protein
MLFHFQWPLMCGIFKSETLSAACLVPSSKSTLPAAGKALISSCAAALQSAEIGLHGFKK